MTEKQNTELPERPLDCVVRLREFEGSDELGNGDFSLLGDAADEIERLSLAIKWCLGEAPDSNGGWFEPSDDEPKRPDGSPVARYWWRSKLRRMIEPNVAANPAADK